MEIIKKIIYQTTPTITITGITTGNVLITGCTGTCRVIRTGTMGTVTGKIIITGATGSCRIIVTGYTGSSDSIIPTYHLKLGLVSVVKDAGFFDAYDSPLIYLSTTTTTIAPTPTTTSTTTLAPVSTTTTTYSDLSTTTTTISLVPTTTTTTNFGGVDTLFTFVPI